MLETNYDIKQAKHLMFTFFTLPKLYHKKYYFPIPIPK